MAQNFTNFYLPHLSDSLVFVKGWTNLKLGNKQTEEDKHESIEKIIVSIGFVDACKENDAYLQLLEELGLDDMSYHSFIEELGINV